MQEKRIGIGEATNYLSKRLIVFLDGPHHGALMKLHTYVFTSLLPSVFTQLCKVMHLLREQMRPMKFSHVDFT